MMSPIASFHLVRFRRRMAPLALGRLGTDRLALRGVTGLQFIRTLGTGHGRSTAWSIDPARTAMFAVWDDASALDAFLTEHPVAKRWQKAHESWHVRLHQVDGHGVWGGYPLSERLGREERGDGPVVMLTRAKIGVRSWPKFVRQARGVSDRLAHSDGLLDVVGVGEAPVLRNGTLSLWRSHDDIDRFVAHDPAHLVAMRRADDEGWFTEQCFIRFRPEDAHGRWEGRNPLR